jgi:TRAP-type mannitol/chloroaromatic compound transport system permease small subunit
MQGLLKLSEVIDRILGFIGRMGAWTGLMLVFVVMYDVVTRYLGVSRGFGLNATQLQESEYWLHTILFCLVIGWAYTKQAHVRIDLLRDRLGHRTRYLIEILGCLLLLIPFSLMTFYFNLNYAQASFQEHEISKSVIGLTHVWILKSFLPAMFVLLLLAATSQLIKSIAGFLGVLPEDKVAGTLGGDL